MFRELTIPRQRVLAESMVANPRWAEGQYFKKFLKEGILQGNITGETPSVDATLEVLNQIIMGAEGHIPLDFARLFTTDKAVLRVPIGTYGVAVVISAGKFGNSPKTATSVPITLDKEYGVEVTWTRAHLEDATWDVLSEQNQGAGYAIKACLLGLLVAALKTNATKVGVIDLGDWKEIVAFLGAVDIAGYGPADFCLVSPTDYWTLLGMDQFINSLYAGSDEVMRTGVAKTMTGVTFLKCDGIVEPIAVNSRKAIALAYRRNVTVEPFEYPDTNKYGFIASVRAKVKMLNALAGAQAKAA